MQVNEAHQQKLREWTFDARGNRPLGHRLAQFFQKALELVNADEAGTTQEVIELLATASGLLRLHELLKEPYDGMSKYALVKAFKTQMLPFLQLVTHRLVLTSPLIATRVLTIYNMIYYDGQLLMPFFTATMRHLQHLDLSAAEDGYGINEDAIAGVKAFVFAIAKLVEVCTLAQTNENLKSLVESVVTFIDGSSSADVQFALSAARKKLEQVQRRLGLGHALPDVTSNHQTIVTKDRATFEFQHDLPGELSADGPRHDNDKTDIREISILPSLSEVQSERNEYLPLVDPQEWHIGGLKGLLDRQFRLLREDTIGQLRDAAKFELERLQDPYSQQSKDRKRQGARTYVYPNVAVHDCAFTGPNGMEFALGFDQPSHLSQHEERARRNWWEHSKRLGPDALVCLINSEGLMVFFTISRPPMGKQKIDHDMHKHFDLWQSPDRAFIVARPVNSEDIHTLLNKMLWRSEAIFSLVEFPGVLLPAFMPTLQAMQEISTSMNVPFENIIAPTATSDDPDETTKVDPPQYTTKREFGFDLSPILTPGSYMIFHPKQDLDAAAQELATKSTLDFGQAVAIVTALSRCLALIQGPPGTGKSYTGVQLILALLAAQKENKLGPILYVCYTNHALDQQQERLMDAGVTNIVRIGGKSKSERLAGVNLRQLAQELENTKVERSDRWKHKQSIEKDCHSVREILRDMRRALDQERVTQYLAEYHPAVMRQFKTYFQDEDGFTTVNYQAGNIFVKWLNEGRNHTNAVRSVDVLRNVSIKAMNGSERYLIWTSWLSDMWDRLQDHLRIALETYNTNKESLNTVRSEIDLRVLKEARVVAVTTSGLARNLDLLRRLDCKVLICEEAGEVMESHLLTAMLPSVEHAILIGDHQQLRPHIQNHDLSVESRAGSRYALDRSLFERLVEPPSLHEKAMPFCTLAVQRRMHPYVSRLIRNTIYPRLEDADVVQEYPEIVGMRDRMFWMHHEVPEDENAGGAHATSKTNAFEVEMTAALVRHLLRQGIYKSQEIAVLTPYLGQLRKIRQALSKSVEILLNDRDLDDLAKDGEEPDASDPAPGRHTDAVKGSISQAVRIATVDNFQGEEAKVIVISLVRSNKEANPGFLKTSNRINVLLSRAQHGMYILGNSHTVGNVDMWAQVINMLRENDQLDNDLALCCPRHPDKPMFVRTPEDFVRLAPEAGCNLVCQMPLACGHQCESACHSDLLHSAVYCEKPCFRPKPGCKHNCPLPCGAECESECKIRVTGVDIRLECGHHKTSLPCYQFQDNTRVRCDVEVERTVPGCGHIVSEPCFVDVQSPLYTCEAQCGTVLDCGHTCKRRCHECRQPAASEKSDDSDGSYDSDNESGIADGGIKIDHGTCTTICDRPYSMCKHRCRKACHGKDPCPLCTMPCDVRCSHSACSKKCSEPCVPCAEPTCASFCPHSSCPLPCSAPCIHIPCTLRCTKSLSCGCQCPSVCGEICPPAHFCQNCASEDIKAEQADLVMLESYGEIDLDDDPCIFPPCGHIFTLSSMDGIMDMKKHYNCNSKDEPESIKTFSEPFSSTDMKTCPTCRGSLRNVNRYGRIVRRAMLDAGAKKLTTWSQEQHESLAQILLVDQNKLCSTLSEASTLKKNVRLVGSVQGQIRAVRQLHVDRYREILTTRTAIEKFVHAVRRKSSRVSG